MKMMGRFNCGNNSRSLFLVTYGYAAFSTASSESDDAITSSTLLVFGFF
jgi:hypothetical protein